MVTQNGINTKVTNNADGFDQAGGSTARKLTITGADITLTGSGTNIYTFPTATSTLYSTQSGSITSAQLATSLTNETGTNVVVFNTDPSLIRPVISGTAAADGALGFDSTQHALTYYSSLSGSTGTVPRVLSVTLPGTTLTNSTTSDQDYSTVYTIPANALITGKTYRVTLNFHIVTGVSSATTTMYLKVGTTKIFTTNTASGNLSDSKDNSGACTFLITGTAAASASASVQVGQPSTPLLMGIGNAQGNTILPQNLATNGTLAITPGLTFSSTGSTENITLYSAIVEELN